MNTEQISKNILTYIKTHYVETIPAKIWKLEKTMIKYSSYNNHLRFSFRCHHTIRAKVSLALLNSKPPKDKLSKDERKALKELQSDTSILILPADKVRSTVILNREDYLEKCMDFINNVPYQLLEKDPTTKIKAKTLKQLKVLKDNEFIDNKLYYYLKPTDSPAPRFYGQPKIHKPGVPIRPIFHIVAPCCTILTNT